MSYLAIHNLFEALVSVKKPEGYQYLPGLWLYFHGADQFASETDNSFFFFFFFWLCKEYEFNFHCESFGYLNQAVKWKDKISFSSPHLGSELCSADGDRFLPSSLGTNYPYIHLDILRADYRFVPSQWETGLLCNNVSHWLGASLESSLPFSTPWGTCCRSRPIDATVYKSICSWVARTDAA